MELNLIALIVVGVGAWVFISFYLKKKRQQALFKKYGDMQIVNMIMKQIFWQGETPEQIKDSLGEPIDIEQKVMKRKTTEVWKYRSIGKGRYSLRIMFENGTVVGWENKSS